MNKQSLSLRRLAAEIVVAGALSVMSITTVQAAKSPENLACDGSEPEYSLDQQIAGCSALIARDPTMAAAYYNRGYTYTTMGEYDKAIADYDAAIALKPDYEAAFVNRGFVYYKKGQYDRAIADYDHALSLKGDDADAFDSRGDAYVAKGNYDQAIADYQQALKLNPLHRNTAASLKKAQEARAKAAGH